MRAASAGSRHLRLSDYPESEVNRPDFSLITLTLGDDPTAEQNHAWSEWQLGNIDAVMLLLGQHDYLEFLVRNRKQLKNAKMYERAFFNAFICGPTGALTIGDVLALLALADREKLRAIGTAFTATKPITLYRGVAMPTRRLALRTSWTKSIAVAKIFADREAGRNKSSQPTIFQLTVPPDRLVFFTNERQEEEFFVDIWPEARPMKISKP